MKEETICVTCWLEPHALLSTLPQLLFPRAQSIGNWETAPTARFVCNYFVHLLPNPLFSPPKYLSLTEANCRKRRVSLAADHFYHRVTIRCFFLGESRQHLLLTSASSRLFLSLTSKEVLVTPPGRFFYGGSRFPVLALDLASGRYTGTLYLLISLKAPHSMRADKASVNIVLGKAPKEFRSLAKPYLLES